MWSWWMPWYQTWNGGFVDKTSAAEWKKCMNDPRVITLDDMKEAGWGALGTITTVDAAEQDAPRYDLQGRRLSSVPAHGIFIRDGRIEVIR